MLTHIHKSLSVVLATLLLAFTFTSQASDKPTEDPNPPLDELMRLVDQALPTELITEDNTELVALLLKPRLGIPLSESFDSVGTIKRLFGRGGASLSPDCRKLTTPVGDMAEDECVASKGTESGAGAYRMLRFSKHMEFGNIVYTNRGPDQTVDPAKLVPVRMTDNEAYSNAVTFLKELGLPGEEFPVIPADARRLPVRTIALGWADDKTAASVPVEKMVMIPRGLFVGVHAQLEQVAGPGNALVIMDDLGVKEAIVQGWQEVQPHPKAKMDNAKTRSELVREIAEDIASDLQGPVRKINIQVKLMVAATENGVGLLLPAVQAAVLPVARDLTEAQQEELGLVQTTTAGMIREYSLVHMFEEFDQSDDELPR